MTAKIHRVGQSNHLFSSLSDSKQQSYYHDAHTQIVELRFAPSLQLVGTVNATLVVRTNVDGFTELKIPFTAFVAHPLRISPEPIVIRRSEPHSHVVTVQYVRGRQFRIVDVSLSDFADLFSAKYSPQIHTDSAKITIAFSDLSSFTDAKELRIVAQDEENSEMLTSSVPVVVWD
jgi:hypothetical protein